MAVRPTELILRRLIHMYLREVTPSKSGSKQAHDRRVTGQFLSFFDAQTDPKRRSDRPPDSLDREDWDEFVVERRTGRIAGYGPVRERAISYDLKFLIAMLSRAEGANEGDPHFIVRNPWYRARRKAQGMVMPREKNPRRPTMTEVLHELLLRQSPTGASPWWWSCAGRRSTAGTSACSGRSRWPTWTSRPGR